MAKKPKARPRNPKGQGDRLRDEILGAARRILEESGTEDAVTLRATAREAGVTAPAIYSHFANREEMVETVIAAAFDEFATAVLGEMTGIEDPTRRLRAACRAYVDYGHRHPATYRVIFTRHRPSALPSVAASADAVFQILVDLLDESAAIGRRDGGDARTDAATLWLGMHGLATLPPSHPRFDWPEQDVLLDRLIERLGGVTKGSSTTGP
jgi:AcrR family transcriptional regulator